MFQTSVQLLQPERVGGVGGLRGVGKAVHSEGCEQEGTGLGDRTGSGAGGLVSGCEGPRGDLCRVPPMVLSCSGSRTRALGRLVSARSRLVGLYHVLEGL